MEPTALRLSTSDVPRLLATSGWEDDDGPRHRLLTENAALIVRLQRLALALAGMTQDLAGVRRENAALKRENTKLRKAATADSTYMTA